MKKMPHVYWKRGGVLKLFMGRDNLARSVLVIYETSRYDRSVAKLYVYL